MFTLLYSACAIDAYLNPEKHRPTFRKYTRVYKAIWGFSRGEVGGLAYNKETRQLEGSRCMTDKEVKKVAFKKMLGVCLKGLFVDLTFLGSCIGVTECTNRVTNSQVSNKYLNKTEEIRDITQNRTSAAKNILWNNVLQNKR